MSPAIIGLVYVAGFLVVIAAAEIYFGKLNKTQIRNGMLTVLKTLLTIIAFLLLPKVVTHVTLPGGISLADLLLGMGLLYWLVWIVVFIVHRRRSKQGE